MSPNYLAIFIFTLLAAHTRSCNTVTPDDAKACLAKNAKVSQTAAGLQIYWYPSNQGATLIKTDEKKYLQLHFGMEEAVKGKFKTVQLDARSFSFSIEDGGKPVLKCNVKNLPDDISSAPSHKIINKSIILKVRKRTAGSWKDKLTNDKWEYPALADM